jgi:hypothetical protein
MNFSATASYAGTLLISTQHRYRHFVQSSPPLTGYTDKNSDYVRTRKMGRTHTRTLRQKLPRMQIELCVMANGRDGTCLFP